VLIVDDLLLGGFRFVLSRLAEAVDAETRDDRLYREELLAAQMRLELGEISEEEFREVETDLLAKIREIRERHGVAAPAATEGMKISGVEIDAALGETPAPEEPAPTPAPARRRGRGR
jgi:hypothetical protein